MPWCCCAMLRCFCCLCYQAVDAALGREVNAAILAVVDHAPQLHISQVLLLLLCRFKL